MVQLTVVFSQKNSSHQLSTKRYFSNTMAKRNFFFSLPLKMINKRFREENKDEGTEEQEIWRIFSSLKQVIL
jgi:hypothetical protein